MKNYPILGQMVSTIYEENNSIRLTKSKVEFIDIMANLTWIYQKWLVRGLNLSVFILKCLILVTDIAVQTIWSVVCNED